MPVGMSVFKVKLRSGYEAKYDFGMPHPGSTETGVYEKVYNEDYKGSTDDKYIQTVTRAQIEKGRIDKTQQTAVIQFSINDDNLVYSGELVFYNSNHYFIGTMGYFKDFKTGDNPPYLNEGNGLIINDSNTVEFSDSDSYIRFTDNYSFNDIAKVVVVLTDGEQYVGSSSTYDSRSRSEAFTLELLE